MRYLIALLLGVFVVAGHSFSQNRFWVGGEGEWKDKSHWSVISGGQAGAPVPTIDDNVIIDENSFFDKKNNIFIDGDIYCKSIISDVDINIKGKGKIFSIKNIVNESFIKYNKKNVQIKQLSYEKTGYTISVSATAATCHGICDGTISVTFNAPAPNYPVSLNIQNGVLGYDSTWIVYGDTTISGLCGETSNYWVITQDQDGDVEFTSINVHEPAQITVNLENNTNPSCGGVCDGKIDLVMILTEAPPIVSYEWSDGNNWHPRDSLCAGTYDVTLTDSDGCTGTHSVTLTEPPPIVVNDSTYTPFICGGGANGSININASGGTGTLTYDIGGGIPTNTDGNFTGLTNGTYTVTITDDSGCSITSGPYTLNNNPAISISDVSTNPTCNGVCNGIIDITVTGGAGGFTYNWVGPGSYTSTSEDTTSLCAGTYDLTVTDAVNCTATYSITLTEPDSIYFNGTSTDLACNGVCDGSITLNTTGGDGNYTYTWTPNVSSNDSASGLCAGTYNISVTDGNSCTNDTSIIISEPLAITIITDSTQNITCNGGSNGAISISVSGGSGSGYTYNWQTPDGSGLVAGAEDQSGLSAGTYDLTVTDGSGCTQTSSWTLTEPPLLDATETHFDISCSGSTDGSIDLTVVGGVPGYSFSWTGPGGFTANTEDISNLGVGTYCVTVTDANSCTDTLCVDIVDPYPITIIDTLTHILCNGDSTGAINIEVTGGNQPIISWSWTGPGGFTANTEDISGLYAGTYSVTVTDSHPLGCTQTATYVLTEPPALQQDSLPVNQPSCLGYNDASAIIYISGGVPNYTYAWCNGDNTNDVDSLSAGTCYVTVTDNNGCQYIDSAVVVDPPGITISSETPSDIQPCNGDCNGSISIVASGGTLPLQYDIGSGGQSTGNFSSLCAGTYQVTITDANTCSITGSSLVLNEPPVLTSTDSSTNALCNGDTTGTATVYPSGGVPGYTYLWDSNANNQTTQTAINLAAGQYMVTITDNIGCSIVDTANVLDNSSLIVNIANISDAVCFGQCNGGASINVSGGTPPYTYLWCDASTDTTVSGLCAGTCSVTVTDNLGCLRVENVTINQPDSIEITFTNIQDLICYGDTIGAFTVSVTGGVPPYQYSLDGAPYQTDSSYSNLGQGVYTVTVMDASGCTNTNTINLPQNPVLVGNISQLDFLSCYGDCDATLIDSVSGGLTPYSFVWSPGGETTQTISNLCAGDYSVTVTDAAGCTFTDNYTITQPDSITINMVVDAQVNCDSQCTGHATAIASGGTSGYSYLWDSNANNQPTDTAGSLCGGIYFITVTDANSCTNSNWVEIIDTSNLSLSIIDSTLNNCYGDCIASYTVQADSGYAPYSYMWSNLDNDSIAENLCAGLITVTVTDDSSCTRSLVINVPQPDSISLTLSQTPVTCNSDCDGTATVAASGGTPGYLYAWNDPLLQGTPTAVMLCPNTYTVTVTDNNSCTKIDSIAIVNPPVLDTVSTNVTDVLCYGDTSGTATITLTGGVPPYTYLWSNGQTDSTAINLGAGTYYVTTTDAGGCARVDSLLVNQPPDSVSVSFSTVESACSGNCIGLAAAIVSGGTPGYTYQWDANAGGGTNDTAYGLCVGFYDITVTDLNMCTITATVEIEDTSSLVLNIDSITNISCNGLCDGKALVSATGGFPSSSPPPDYYFSWSTGDTLVDNLSGLCVGQYSVTVYDDSLCSDVDTFSISNISAFAANFNVTDITCYGLNNGQIIVYGTGGALPIDSITWYDSSTDTIVSGLSAGYYNVTIVDQNGCTVVDSAQVIEPADITIAFNIDTSISCYGQCDGVITATATGGTVLTDYLYQWDDMYSQTTQTADSLCAGIYNITVTDDNGCSSTGLDSLVTPDSISISFVNFTPIDCGGDSTGQVTALPAGGTIPYSFNWSNGDTLATADSLPAGFYYITVTDYNGCSDSNSFEVTDTSNITVTLIDSSDVQCYGMSNGSLTIQATGGTVAVDYTYTWDIPATGSSVSSLSAGTYTVSVQDDNLCLEIESYVITEPDTLIATITDSVSITCANSCNGSLTVSVSGGTQPYSYIWNNDTLQTDTIISTLCAGSHIILVTDSNNCVDSALYNMTAPPVLSDSIQYVNSLCSNNTYDGQATVIASGGTPPYTYLWSNDSTTQTIDSLEGGLYYITITDSLNCSTIDSVTIDPGIVVNSIAESDTLICQGDTVEITGSGYLMNQISFWATDLNHTDSIIMNPLSVNPTEPTTYYYFVYDSICYDVDSVMIDVYPLVGVDAGDDVEIFLDESTQLQATGGEDTVTYLWIPNTWLDDPNIANPVATPEETTTYYVYITTPSGCVEYDSVTVTVVTTLLIPSGFTPNGDGINDTWEIDNLDFFSDVLIEIYNRWGEKLFIFRGHGKDYEHVPENRWDGLWKGKPVPIGTYYYIIDFHDEFEEKPKTGPLTIMR